MDLLKEKLRVRGHHLRVAAAVVGSAVVGGAISASASKSAAKTEAQSEANAQALQKDIFDKQVELQAPFRDVGLAANNRLAYLLGLVPGSNSSAPIVGNSGTGTVAAQSFGGLPRSAVNLASDAVPGLSGIAQMLRQGSDGVFQPEQAPQSIAPATPIPAGQAGTALTQLGLADRFNVSPDGQSFVSRMTGQSIPLSYFTSGQYQNEAQTGNFGQYQGAITPPPPAPAQALAPAVPANDFSGFGSLNQGFGASDFAADGAPKIAPFTQQAPQAQNFAQFQGSTPIGQYQGAQQLGSFQGTPQFGDYQGAQNLDGFTDMPAFRPRTCTPIPVIRLVSMRA